MSMKDPSFTLGVEEEYLLIDKDTRDLAGHMPSSLMKACQERLGERVSPEFLQSQIEVQTNVCRSVGEAIGELHTLRRDVAEIAAVYNLAPIAASTHPFADWDAQERTKRKRYEEIEEDMQVVARRLLICGMHIHIGIEDDDLRIDLMNQIVYFLPHILALSTSSPFWKGENTGLQSYRVSVFDEFPRTGLPPPFSSYSEYQRTMKILTDAELIEDQSKLWWDVRPSSRFPTLEIRLCDICPRLIDTAAIIAFSLCLMRMLYRLRKRNQKWREYSRFLIQENRWRAQRYGPMESMVDFGEGRLLPYSELMDEVIDILKDDAVYFNCEKELLHIKTISQKGTSASRQIACFNKAIKDGASKEDALKKVVDLLVEETISAPE